MGGWISACAGMTQWQSRALRARACGEGLDPRLRGDGAMAKPRAARAGRHAVKDWIPACAGMTQWQSRALRARAIASLDPFDLRAGVVAVDAQVPGVADDAGGDPDGGVLHAYAGERGGV